MVLIIIMYEDFLVSHRTNHLHRRGLSLNNWYYCTDYFEYFLKHYKLYTAVIFHSVVVSMFASQTRLTILFNYHSLILTPPQHFFPPHAESKPHTMRMLCC